MATEKTLSDLAAEAMVKSIPTKPLEESKSESPCDDKDTACNQRWIDAFSDCC